MGVVRSRPSWLQATFTQTLPGNAELPVGLRNEVAKNAIRMRFGLVIKM
jgi:hypothetical protein